MRGTLTTGLLLGFLAVSVARAQNAAEVPGTAQTNVVAADDQQKPSRLGFLKQAIRAFLSDDETEGSLGLRVGPFVPRVDIVTSGGGPAPLYHFWMPAIGRTPLDIHASASLSIYS
jgi:hypothetical protein